MILKYKITSLLILATVSIYGQQETTIQDSALQNQQTVNQDTIIKKEIQLSFLDSIKKTFRSDEMATCIDQRWMDELGSLDIYNDLLADIKNVDPDQTVDYELPTELLKQRLKLMDEKSPFNIEYNIGLENVIKSFLKNRKKGFERLMGISQFYFPIFEEELAKNNIPLEIKYLAVVESALNPKAISRVGATGLWQFMYQTGKQYGLNISSYVDERSDPLLASKAASKYMMNMYKIFGDWDLVLASYNSGPGNVAKAIRRSGGQQNYWNIRKNLPRETQGYLPAFLATMYIFEYHKEHGIVPNKAIANHFATDTIMVKKAMTFRQISDLLDISVDELQFFNPSYKRNEVPYVTGEANFLRLPKSKIGIFTSNEDKIYAYVDNESSKRERPNQRLASVKQNDPSNISQPNSEFTTRTKFHKVRKGDNLSKIANKYDISIVDLKKWNGLRSNNAPLGRNLKIISREKIAYKDKKIITKDSIVKIASNEIAVNDSPIKVDVVKESKSGKTYKTEKVVTFKEVTKYHKVKKGDNLGEIASKYNVAISDLKKWNKLKNNNLQLGNNLKIVSNEKVTTTVRKEIKHVADKNESVVAVLESKQKGKAETKSQPIKEEKAVKTDSENYYVVVKGDNLLAIARKNNVSVQNIKEWNNLIDNNVITGSQLIISNNEIASNTNNQEAKNLEHVVAKGEFLGAIARKYKISVDELREWNHITDNSVQAGTKLIVGKEDLKLAEAKSKNFKKEVLVANENREIEKLYQVRSGDSLFSISKKFPGVTISDIKKWNNMKGESIKPGMKLKING